ncbi:MAG: hypothetical protein WCN95_13045 [bacterium]
MKKAMSLIAVVVALSFGSGSTNCSAESTQVAITETHDANNVSVKVISPSDNYWVRIGFALSGTKINAFFRPLKNGANGDMSFPIPPGARAFMVQVYTSINNGDCPLQKQGGRCLMREDDGYSACFCINCGIVGSKGWVQLSGK